MKSIQLTHGQVTLVDDADFEWLNQWTWHAHIAKGSAKYYACRFPSRKLGPRKMIHMAALIMGESVGLPDHINGNGLDNQRHNLRLATHSQNGMNSKVASNNTSGFKGVHWCKPKNCWAMQIQCGDVQYRKSGFLNAEEAGRHYDTKARELAGEFARLNFPDEIDGVPLVGYKAITIPVAITVPCRIRLIENNQVEAYSTEYQISNVRDTRAEAVDDTSNCISKLLQERTTLNDSVTA